MLHFPYLISDFYVGFNLFQNVYLQGCKQDWIGVIIVINL